MHGASIARFDAVTLLTVFLFALVAIPSELIVGALGSAGTPAQIIAIGMLIWWMVTKVSTPRVVQTRQPIRIMMWLFAAAVVASYVAANSRQMMSDEARSSDLGLLLLSAWLGILLIAMDLIGSRDRLDVLLRRVVFAAGALATLGVVQFVTREPFTNYIQIPGLNTNEELISVYGRAGLARPAGTAVHPIEFGAVLTMALPVALHYALTDLRRPLIRRWYPVAAIAIAVPISISRSAIVSAIVVLCFLIPTWAPPIRRRGYIAIVGLNCAVYLMVPGLLGTLRGLFIGVSTDSSAQSRSGSFSLALDFFSRSPFIGRGFGTFLPAYRILDDQYLGLLIETGLVGLAAFLGLLIASVVNALWLRRHMTSPVDASLCIALAASVASASISLALFDGLSFPMSAGLMFLLLGCIGALHRLRATNRKPLLADDDLAVKGSPLSDPV
jgi:polysaccharide biosynthesis protein PslJ